MEDWKSKLKHVVADIEERVDHFKNRLLLPFASKDIVIIPYIGYVSLGTAFLRGRVVRNIKVSRSNVDDEVWKNLLNIYRRFGTDEIGFAKVRGTIDDQTVEVTCDDEGYFFLEIPCNRPAKSTKAFWNIELEVVSLPNEELPEDLPRYHGKVLAEPESPQYGMISDLDDTVMRTDAINLLKLARNTMLGNAHTRLPFEGVAEFYSALQVGTESGFNPLFYVSSSPWNLYDLIQEFFEVRGIPDGPLFLRDFGLSETQFIGKSHEEHKQNTIQTILNAYPELNFILIGDSGQHDPEIYSQVAINNPGRVAAIYIRDVNEHGSRHGVIKRIGAELQAHAVDMLLTNDSFEAAQHAHRKRFITKDQLDQVKASVMEEKQTVSEIEVSLANLPSE